MNFVKIVSFSASIYGLVALIFSAQGIFAFIHPQISLKSSLNTRQINVPISMYSTRIIINSSRYSSAWPPYKKKRINVLQSNGDDIATENSEKPKPRLYPQEYSNIVPLLPKLKNFYCGLRHGQSEANVEGVISSNPEIGCVKHGLTELGKEQAQDAGEKVINLIWEEGIEQLIVCSSDFTRAIETANECVTRIKQICIAADKLENLAQIHVYEGIRERSFGELDGQELEKYDLVWPLDNKDATQENYSVESVLSVCQRIHDLIIQLENEYPEGNKNILLVSHADTLQIAQFYMAGLDVRMFNKHRFSNGEVRELHQNKPNAVPLSIWSS